MTTRMETVSRRAVVAALTLVVAVTAAGGLTRAQEHKAHRVVFEVTSTDAQAWQSVLNNVENVKKALGSDATDIRVVAHGGGLGMLLKADTALAGRIASLTGPRVQFVACENTMKRRNVTKEDLLPSAGTVDSGVAEVVRLQEGGWSYLKSGS